MKARLNTIQAGRALAALAVAFYHGSQNVEKNFGKEFFGNIFYFGYAGVDFFFVLSGFIICYSSYHLIGNKQEDGLKNFIKKRVIRIYPIYWVYLFGLLALMYVLPQYVPADTAFDLSNIWKTILLLFTHDPILTTSWSLSHEIYFYFIFALLIVNKRFKLLVYAILVGTIVNVGNQYINQEFLFDRESVWERLFSGYNFEFLLGYAVFRFWNKIKLTPSILLLVVGIAMLTIAALFLEGKVQIGEFSIARYRLFVYGLPSAMIILGLIGVENHTSLKVPRWLIVLGDASFTFYLIHRPILSALNTIIIKKMNIVVINISVTVTLFIVVISALCVGLYYLIEKPLFTKLLGRKKDKPKPAESATASEAKQ